MLAAAACSSARSRKAITRSQDVTGNLNLKESVMKKSHLPTRGLTPVAAAAAVATSSTATAAQPTAQPTKSRGRPRESRPYQIEGRSGWCANPTLPDGTRPLRKFETEEEAGKWIEEVLAKAALGLQPALGGPERATVGQLLFKYAYRATILKGGAEAELTRINNYLAGGGLPSWASWPRRWRPKA
jgi:hypothetical protein